MEYNTESQTTENSNDFENSKPKIVVMGIGGAGGNAVNNMIRSNLEGVEFVVANTDAQALRDSLATHKIQLGSDGLGAGSKPSVGFAAAEEAVSEIEKYLKNTNMVFITAGMGGGTGTGAAPVIAKIARAAGVLTVGVVTKPFLFEGTHRMRTADAGLDELQAHVDTLIVIPNQNLFRLADNKTTFTDAFNMADNVLYSGVRGITDLIILTGLVNLDFADVRTVMKEMGKAMMGTGEAEGENRAINAAEAAIANPLLDEVSLKGARRLLINITGGLDMTLFEVDEAANHIREQVDPNANIIFGSTFDDRLRGKLRVSVVATGIENNSTPQNSVQNNSVKIDPIIQGGQLSFEEKIFEKAPSDDPSNIGSFTHPDVQENGSEEPFYDPFESLNLNKNLSFGEQQNPAADNQNKDETVVKEEDTHLASTNNLTSSLKTPVHNSFQNELNTEKNPTENNISVNKKSFWQKFSFKKDKNESEYETGKKESYLVHSKISSDPSTQPSKSRIQLKETYDTTKDLVNSVEKKSNPLETAEDDFDIPAFLRRKK